MNFNEWLNIDDDKRGEVLSQWNAYEGEGMDVLSLVEQKFKADFTNYKDMEIHGIGINHGGTYCLSVKIPIIFDNRVIPDTYLGVDVKRTGPLTSEMPDEFKDTVMRKGYVWAPERFEEFVDNHQDEIRRKLNNHSMTRNEMLDAICFGDYQKHKADYQKWLKEGKVERYVRHV